MNNKNHTYTKVKYITFLIIVIGIFFPSTTTAQSQVKSSLPTIISFTITQKTPNKINGYKTNWIEFNWEIEGADRVKLYKEGVEIKSRSQRSNGEIGWPLSMAGSFKSQHKKSAIYELVGENDKGKVSEKLDIKLKKKRIPPTYKQPMILDFRVEPPRIKPGGQVSFYWQVKNAYQVRLYDSFGEIKSGIQLPKGNYGWPLSMNAAYSENLNKSETYKLVVTGKNGTVSRTVKVLVPYSKCKLNVNITGKYTKYTTGISVFKVIPGNTRKFLFKSPVKRFHKEGKIFYKSIIDVLPGNYYLVPYGGGKDKHGDFGVMYKPRNINYSCRDGKTKHIMFKAEFAEY